MNTDAAPKSATDSSAAATPKLPSGYPSTIPTPTDGTLTSAQAITDTSKPSYSARYQLASSAASSAKSYQEQLKAAGFSIDEFPGPGASAFFGASRDKLSLTVTIENDQKQSNVSLLTIDAVAE